MVMRQLEQLKWQKKIRNIDGDDSDDGSNSLPLVFQLPSAPRASRIFDDDSVPHKAPFIGHITNLPFDINEDDIHAFFSPMPLVSLRLPREDGDTGRLRGFGYIELQSRDDLIYALSLPDPCIKGRRIRIDLPNDQDQQNKHRFNKRGFDNSNDHHESTNWRKDNTNADSSTIGYSDRGNRERNNDDNNTPGSWRVNNRPTDNLRGDHSKHRGEKYRSDGFERGSYKENDLSAVERPKLNLKPRTLPLPEIVKSTEYNATQGKDLPPASAVKPTGVSVEKVFGSAKPVDTASREKEIEERMADARRKEQILLESERANIEEKMETITLKKDQKDSANSVISWRRKTENASTEDNSFTDRTEQWRDREYNRNSKFRDGVNRSEVSSRKKQSNRDEKFKDESKRVENKIERTIPKQQSSNDVAPVLHSSNKYSGLEDEASE